MASLYTCWLTLACIILVKLLKWFILHKFGFSNLICILFHIFIPISYHWLLFERIMLLFYTLRQLVITLIIIKSVPDQLILWQRVSFEMFILILWAIFVVYFMLSSHNLSHSYIAYLPVGNNTARCTFHIRIRNV